MDKKPEFLAYFNGRFLPNTEAIAQIGVGEQRRSGGLFDAERTFSGRVFRLRDHLGRLYRGLEQAQIDPGLTLSEMEAATLQVVEANRELIESGDDLVVAQVVSGSSVPSSNGPPEVDVLIYGQLLDFADFAQGYVSGVRVVTPVTYSAPPPRHPDQSGRSNEEVWTLSTDEQGYVTECARANFMFVRDGRIKLPDRTNVLPGISMATILDLAEPLGIGVDEGRYSTHDVYNADEALVSGTRYCLLPVATVNGVSLGHEIPGPVTRRLIEAWSQKVGLDFVAQALSHLPAEGA